jgi:hypothetical protein
MISPRDALLVTAAVALLVALALIAQAIWG